MQKQQEGSNIRSQIVENPHELQVKQHQSCQHWHLLKKMSVIINAFRCLQKTLEEKKVALSEEEDLMKKAYENLERWKAKTEVITKVGSLSLSPSFHQVMSLLR